MRNRRARQLRKIAVLRAAHNGIPATPIYRMLKRKWNAMPKLQDRDADRLREEARKGRYAASA